jgi:hypothetical protein
LYEIHSIRSDYTIKDAIDSGKRLGRQLDEDSIQKLDLEYLGEKTSPKATAYEDIGNRRNVQKKIPSLSCLSSQPMNSLRMTLISHTQYYVVILSNKALVTLSLV